jgi:hypothetical protein
MEPKAEDAGALTAEQRRLEIARILAAGVLRMRDHACLQAVGPSPRNPPESERNCLELGGDPRLSVHTG